MLYQKNDITLHRFWIEQNYNMLNFKGLKKMKKVFVIFAVAAMIVACTKPAPKVEETVDSAATAVVDTAAQVVDSAATAVVDSAAAVAK